MLSTLTPSIVQAGRHTCRCGSAMTERRASADHRAIRIARAIMESTDDAVIASLRQARRESAKDDVKVLRGAVALCSGTASACALPNSRSCNDLIEELLAP